VANLLHFGSDSGHDPDPGFLDRDMIRIQAFLKGSLFTIVILI